jgi:hypothetical protein
MDKERSTFGGWEQVPGKPGEYKANVVTGPVTPEFAKFAEESRARWDIVEWLKVKIKQLSDRATPIKKGD